MGALRGSGCLFGRVKVVGERGGRFGPTSVSRRRRDRLDAPACCDATLVRAARPTVRRGARAGHRIEFDSTLLEAVIPKGGRGLHFKGSYDSPADGVLRRDRQALARCCVRERGLNTAAYHMTCGGAALAQDPLCITRAHRIVVRTTRLPTNDLLDFFVYHRLR